MERVAKTFAFFGPFGIGLVSSIVANKLWQHYAERSGEVIAVGAAGESTESGLGKQVITHDYRVMGWPSEVDAKADERCAAIVTMLREKPLGVVKPAYILHIKKTAWGDGLTNITLV